MSWHPGKKFRGVLDRQELLEVWGSLLEGDFLNAKEHALCGGQLLKWRIGGLFEWNVLFC